MKKNLTQWEVCFHKVAKKLNFNLKDPLNIALMAANGKTFEGMMKKLEGKRINDRKSACMEIYNNSIVCEEELFYALCSELFEVPEYVVKNILKEENK